MLLREIIKSQAKSMKKAPLCTQKTRSAGKIHLATNLVLGAAIVSTLSVSWVHLSIRDEGINLHTGETNVEHINISLSGAQVAAGYKTREIVGDLYVDEFGIKRMGSRLVIIDTPAAPAPWLVGLGGLLIIISVFVKRRRNSLAMLGAFLIFLSIFFLGSLSSLYREEAKAAGDSVVTSWTDGRPLFFALGLAIFSTIVAITAFASSKVKKG